MEKIEDKIGFVLIKARSPGNVGSSARAMKNFNFYNLILIDPRLHKSKDKKGEGSYFKEESERMACKAKDILKNAKIFKTLDEGISDGQLIVGTDPNPPKYQKVFGVEEGCKEIIRRNLRTYILFGTESDGLTNEEISKCHFIIKIPTGEYCDLNVSHSLVIIAFSLFTNMLESLDKRNFETIASKRLIDELKNDYIEIALKSGFLKNSNSKIALELSNIIYNFKLNERSAGILRSLAIRVKSKLKQ